MAEDGLNKVFLLGRLGADPELKMTGSGQAVLKMRLATSETYLDRNKEKQERTEWHSVILWGKRAEGLSKFLSKGMRIMVEGGIRTSSYEKDGEKRYRTEINATNIILCGDKRGGNGGGSSSSGSRDTDDGGDNYDAGSSGGSGAGGGDDDLPFQPRKEP